MNTIRILSAMVSARRADAHTAGAEASPISDAPTPTTAPPATPITRRIPVPSSTPELERKQAEAFALADARKLPEPDGKAKDDGPSLIAEAPRKSSAWVDHNFFQDVPTGESPWISAEEMNDRLARGLPFPATAVPQLPAPSNKRGRKAAPAPPSPSKVKRTRMAYQEEDTGDSQHDNA